MTPQERLEAAARLSEIAVRFHLAGNLYRAERTANRPTRAEGEK